MLDACSALQEAASRGRQSAAKLKQPATWPQIQNSAAVRLCLRQHTGIEATLAVIPTCSNYHGPRSFGEAPEVEIVVPTDAEEVFEQLGKD